MQHDLCELSVPQIPAAGCLNPWPGAASQHSVTYAGQLVLYGQSAGWVIDAVKRLESLGRRRGGWDSYGGLPLDPEIREFAVSILRLLDRDELPVPTVSLGSGGTVQFDWRSKGKELEVELKHGGRIEGVKIMPSGQMEEIGFGGYAAPSQLRQLSGWLMLTT